MGKFVYSFNEGSKDMRDLLGGKGANLAEMTKIGLPVPFGFTVTTEACTRYYEENESIAEDIVEDINVYNTEKEIDDIIKNKKEVILINENILRSLGVPYKKYKDKTVCVAFKKNINIIYFPEQNFSILINSCLF